MAQVVDNVAGDLTAGSANGGPDWLAANQTFYVGINDVLLQDPQTHAFNPNVFTIYSAWAGSVVAARAHVARGEALFNTKLISITGVGGLNDRLGVNSIPGSCTTCHDSPNYGDHSVSFPINIGLADASRRTPDQPLYTLRNNATMALVQSTDPGRALATGKWADIGKFKGTVLRGLAGRAPISMTGARRRSATPSTSIRRASTSA